MNAQTRQWFGTVGLFVQLFCGCLRQESNHPTFYHLAGYSQEPWLGLRESEGPVRV